MKAEEIKMGMLGDYHADEISFENGDKVLAFTKTRLEETVIKVKRFHDSIVDQDETAKTGKRVTVADEHIRNSTWLLFKGNLKPGIVERVNLDRYKCFPTNFEDKSDANGTVINRVAKLPDGGLSCKFKLAEKEYVFKITKYVDNNVMYENGIYIHVEIIDYEGHTQHHNGISDIFWLGDLNGDGKLDLIIGNRNHPNVIADYTLFLSSPEKKGSPQPVAYFRAVGC